MSAMQTLMRRCRLAVAQQSHWLCLIVLVISQQAWGASRDAGWSVRTWSMADGSNNSIAGVVQTPDGYLWVATSAGMNQFDGVHFEHFSIGELLGLSNSNVRELLTSRTGAMWIALDGA